MKFETYGRCKLLLASERPFLSCFRFSRSVGGVFAYLLNSSLVVKDISDAGLESSSPTDCILRGSAVCMCRPVLNTSTGL